LQAQKWRKIEEQSVILKKEEMVKIGSDGKSVNISEGK